MRNPITFLICAIGTIALVSRLYGAVERQNAQHKIDKCVTEQLADPAWNTGVSETYKQSIAQSGCSCGYSLIQHGGFTDLENIAESCTRLSNLEYRNEHETSTI